MARIRYWILGLLLVLSMKGEAQQFRIVQQNDSLNWLVLTTDSTEDKWKLPYPVYQLQTGDVDGNGSVDAIVGVIKKTRYYPKGKRIFIFKNVNGKLRPMWMGSKLGGILQDFRFTNTAEGPGVRALETTTDDYYVVSEYRWETFGMTFVRFLAKKVSKEKALEVFNSK